MEEQTLNVSLLSPVSDLISGAGTDLDLIFGRAGNDVFYPFDPLEDTDALINIDILFGDIFDNTPEEFEVTLGLAGGDPFAILNADIPSIGADRFVLGDEFRPYYTSSNPLSLITTNFLGFNDFALIYDFDPNQDTIQLNGDKDDYLLVKIDALSVSAIAGGEAVPGDVTDFSGYALFSLESGVPDVVSLIAQKPDVELKLDDDGFLFVGDKPEDDPEDKKIGQFGTTGLDYGYAVATDTYGNLYVAGTTSGSLNGPNQGSSDVWVTKYNSSGNQVFAKQFGSAAGESVTEIITDKDGNFYLAGSTTGSFVDTLKSTRGSDAWVAKYSSNGTMLWGRQFGSSAAQTLPGDEFGFSTSAFGLQLDANGDVYLSGLTINDNWKGILDFPVEDDSWVIKLDGATGNNEWTTSTKITPPPQDVDPNFPFLAAFSPFFDESYDLAVDSQGNSYLVGWSQGLTTISDPSRDLQKYDVWLAKVNTAGEIEWVRQFGSADRGSEFGWAVDTDGQDNVYVSGWTNGNLGELSEDFKKAAARDIFLAKFTPDGEMDFTKQFGSPGDDGQYFSDMFIDASDNIFLTGYTDGKLGDGDDDKSINAWIGRFDTAGNNQWIQQLGIKDKADYATGVTVNSGGQLFVTGFTEGLLGTSSSGNAGSAVDAWLAELDIEKGKLQEFEGTSGNVISIADPGAIAVSDVTAQFLVGDDLPTGTKNIPNPGAYYGEILDGMSPFFDPNSANSLQSSLIDAMMNDPSVFGGTMPSLKLEGSDGVNDVLMGFMGDDELKGKKGDDELHGLAGDDKLEGEDGNDTLFGGAGEDEVKGGKDNDELHGDADADKLKGDDGDDLLIGGAGNDELEGEDDNDTLIGVNPDAAKAGFGEYDKLKGGNEADLFVLGGANQAYYVGQGNLDFALIDDFKLDQGDMIQLYSSASYSLGENISGLEKGTAIFFEGNDLIAIVKDVKDLSLTDTSVFSFVLSE